MPVKAIHTDKAPKAIGPYSQAVAAGDFLFISGQIPIDSKTGEVNLGNTAEQTRIVLSNLKAILESQALSLKSVVKTTVFLTSLEDFSKINEVYADFFGEHKPARACVEVSRLPKGVSVEIEAIAFLGKS